MKIIIPETKHFVFSLHSCSEVNSKSERYLATAKASHGKNISKYERLADYKVELLPVTLNYSPQQNERSEQYKVGGKIRIELEAARALVSGSSLYGVVTEVVDHVIDFTPIAETIDKMMSKLKIPDGVTVVVYPSAWYFDMSKWRNVDQLHRFDFDMNVMFVYEDKNGVEHTELGAKNSCDKIEFSGSTSSNKTSAGILVSHQLGTITQKMVDYSLRSMEMTRAGFTEGLTPNQVAGLERKLSAAQDKVSVMLEQIREQYQALYGKAPTNEILLELLGIELNEEDSEDDQD
jgi:hypothetical protein